MEPAPEGIPLGVLDALGQLCLDLQMGTPLWMIEINQLFMTFRQEQLTSKKLLADFARSDMLLFRGGCQPGLWSRRWRLLPSLTGRRRAVRSPRGHVQRGRKASTRNA